MRLNRGLILFFAIVIVMTVVLVAVVLGGRTPALDDETTTQAPQETTAPPQSQWPQVDASPEDRVEGGEGIVDTGLDPAYLILVNKENALGKDYVPANLADVPSNLRVDKSMQLNARALQALTLMMAEMRAAGIDDALVTSAYRSYERQAELYNGYLAEELTTISDEAYQYFGTFYIYTNYVQKGLDRLSLADAQKLVNSYSSTPGYSEHQSGLCVDFIEDGRTSLDLSFENSEAFAWLSQNAHRFGFILRYPKDKEAVTGYDYEPWHYRFVGSEAATAIYRKGITLEEYWAEATA